MDKPTTPRVADGDRVAMLVALPLTLWRRIRDEACDLGVGPSRLIEPVLSQAFGRDREGGP